MLGFGLAMLPVVVVLYERSSPAWLFAIVIGQGLLWPWVARFAVRRSAKPSATEQRNVLVDALANGASVGLIAFNALPSLAFASMMLMDKLAFGGPRMALRCLAVFVAAGFLVSAMNGFAFEPGSSDAVVAACLPLLLIYPALIGFSVWLLSQQVRKQARQLKTQSRTCDLTGIANRRALREAAENELGRFQRGGHPATLILLDVDHFKRVNDTHGHGAGDDILRAVATALRRTLRETDHVGRLGGDEFAVVLTASDGEGLEVVAGRLCAAISRAPLVDGLPVVSVSVGYSTLSTSIEDVDAWMASADAALYRAKAGGRNRAVSAISGAEI